MLIDFQLKNILKISNLQLQSPHIKQNKVINKFFFECFSLIVD